MIYSHVVDWAAAEEKIRQDARQSHSPEVMILDDPIREGHVYSRDDALVEWWREACQWICDNASDMGKPLAESPGWTMPARGSKALQSNSGPPRRRLPSVFVAAHYGDLRIVMREVHGQEPLAAETAQPLPVPAPERGDLYKIVFTGLYEVHHTDALGRAARSPRI